MKEKLSALLDGDLEEHSIRTTLEGLRRDEQLRKEWDAYCLIGDVLRGECNGRPDFVSRVMSSLEDEPVVLAPGAIAGGTRRSVWQAMLPIAASVMGVAAVGWVASALYSSDKGATPVFAAQQRAATAAVASAAVPVSASAKVVATPVSLTEDPHREYVFAHQSMTAGGPIPGAVQYVRSVSDSQDSRQ